MFFLRTPLLRGAEVGCISVDFGQWFIDKKVNHKVTQRITQSITKTKSTELNIFLLTVDCRPWTNQLYISTFSHYQIT